jgi:hypothetical protein
MTSREVMRIFLEEVGQLPMSIGGPEMCGPRKREPTSDDLSASREIVMKQIATNRIVLWFALCMVLIVLIAALIATFKLGATTNTVLEIAGVGSGAEAGLLAWVLRLWSEYNKFVFLLILSQSLSPEEFTKVVLSMFLNKRTAKERDGSAATVSP